MDTEGSQEWRNTFSIGTAVYFGRNASQSMNIIRVCTHSRCFSPLSLSLSLSLFLLKQNQAFDCAV